MDDRGGLGALSTSNWSQQGHRHRARCDPGRSRHATPAGDVMSAPARPQAAVGVFGGSGFYSLLQDGEQQAMTSVWGDPSGSVTVGKVGPATVAFLPRHGPRHHLAPHRVNYRANIDVMRQLGVRSIVAPFACGS